ncbi:MAG TPA: hypothetical protein EYG98_01185 [Sulfurovum sp.]|nr:hypothetical protein [Sulfurovum sp.]
MKLLKNIVKLFLATLILSNISYATSNMNDGYSITEITIIGRDGDISSKTVKRKPIEQNKKKPNPLDIMRGIERNTVESIVPVQEIHRIIISQKKPSIVSQKATKINRYREKTIYLTFDDGPLKGTDNILTVLQEEGVEATMFFVGKHIENNRRLFRKALSMPNLLVTNHTYSHANGQYEHFYSSTSRVVNDIDRAQKIIGGAKYLRLAGRNVWRLPKIHRNDYGIRKEQRSVEIPKYDALRNRGYQIYGWDAEWGYNHSTGYALFDGYSMANKIESQYRRGKTAKDGKVVLLSHDIMFRGNAGANKLRQLIRMLKANGWSFATIDSYTTSTPGIFVKNKAKSNLLSPLDVLKGGLTTKLNDAVKRYESKRVTKLISLGASVNGIDRQGRIALNTAVRANSLTIVKALVNKGARIKNHDASGATPMITANRFNRKDIKSYLQLELNKQEKKIHLAITTK